MNLADTRLKPKAAAAVTDLYAEHALGLVRLAVVVTGDRATAEDVVQDAFLGQYRRWDRLPDLSAPLAYLRVSVMNGCRTAMRRRSRLRLWPGGGAGDDGLDAILEAESGPGLGVAESAEARALLGEEQRAVAAALRTLPRRQLEAVVMRYYLDLSIEETAQVMGISPGTVKSAIHRGLAAVGRALKQGS